MQPNRPMDNFMRAWLDLYAHTGLPKTYALWAGLWVISSVLQDNVVFREGTSRLKPNLYVWLVGPTSAGKSESANPAVELIKEIPGVEVFEGKLTELYLLKYMESIQQKRAISSPTLVNPRISIYSDELAATLGSGPMAEALIQALTQMYGSPRYQYGTGAHGLKDIEHPAITWLACTAPPWMRRAIPRDMLESGFVARMIVAYEPSIMRRRTGVDLAPTKHLLIRDLIRMGALTGDFAITAEAQQFRDEWGDKQIEARQRMDEMTAAIYGKEEEHALKVAMCLTASAGNDLIITKQALFNATKLVTAARDSSIDILRSISMSSMMETKLFLLDTIRKHSPISQKDLRRRVHQRVEDSWQFNKFTTALMAEGMVIVFQGSNGEGPMYEAVIPKQAPVEEPKT